MIRVNIGGTFYEVPEPGESPNWGREATDTIIALAEVLSALFTDGDILATRYTIDNNVGVSEAINGLLFNHTQVSSAMVTYSVSRTNDGVGVSEYGTLYLNYDEDAPIGEKWITTRIVFSGNAGVTFSCTDTGQVEYLSSDIPGATHTGTIVFSAKVVPR